MTAPIDPAGREAELRALADAATPGPWQREGAAIWSIAGDGESVLSTIPRGGMRSSLADLKLMAAAREAVPWLLDRLAEEREKADRLQRQVDAVRAETLREAADEVHREARWQQEMVLRGQGQHIQSVGRLLVVESILLNRAAALDAAQPETETKCLRDGDNL